MSNFFCSLNSAERDLLSEALQIAAAKEKGKEALVVRSPPKLTQRVVHEALPRFMERAYRENDLWNRVEQSLDLPFAFRSEANKALLLNNLRLIPMLQTLSEDDLIVLCSRMDIVRLKGRETILAKNQDGASETSSKTSGNLHISFLLRGGAILRLPSVSCGVEYYPVEQYEAIGVPVTFAALPADSRYECDVECMLLRFPHGVDIALDRVIGQLEGQIVAAQVAFLSQHLRAHVFAHWSPDQYVACARALVPLRVPRRKIIVEQGAPSDALFFICEGQCGVVRGVPLPQSRPHSFSVSLPAALPPISRAGGAPSKVVEVGTLREGEFFGELALLHHDADWHPDVDTVWSRKHWEEMLERALRSPVDYSALEDDEFLPHLSSNESSDSNVGLFSSSSLPRQATVYTATPCVLYMLSFHHCRQMLDSVAFAKLKEFARGYPSRDVLGQQYKRRHRWVQYRKDLMEDVVMSNNSSRNQEKLQPLQFH